jgi:hypothetical protein
MRRMATENTPVDLGPSGADRWLDLTENVDYALQEFAIFIEACQVGDWLSSARCRDLALHVRHDLGDRCMMRPHDPRLRGCVCHSPEDARRFRNRESDVALGNRTPPGNSSRSAAWRRSISWLLIPGIGATESCPIDRVSPRPDQSLQLGLRDFGALKDATRAQALYTASPPATRRCTPCAVVPGQGRA